MITPAECFGMSAQCERQAADATTDSAREVLLEAAAAWSRMGDDLKEREKTGSDYKSALLLPRSLTVRLRARLARDGGSEAEFAAAIAEIIAATPDDLSADDALLLSHEVRKLKAEWLSSCGQLPN